MKIRRGDACRQAVVRAYSNSNGKDSKNNDKKPLTDAKM
jgi:hypothetical protein